MEGLLQAGVFSMAVSGTQDCQSQQAKEETHPASYSFWNFVVTLGQRRWILLISVSFLPSLISPNSCHTLFQGPTYAALPVPASFGTCRDLHGQECALNLLIAMQLSGTTTTAQIGWQHSSTRPAIQILTNHVQSTGFTSDVGLKIYSATKELNRPVA